MSLEKIEAREPAEADTKLARCGCISTVSNLLRESNTSLVTTMFTDPERVVLATDKIDTKKRGRAASVVATYCPFCGDKYVAQSKSGARQ